MKLRHCHWNPPKFRVISSSIAVLEIIFCLLPVCVESSQCSEPFEGFGVYLGSPGHFARSRNGTIANVIDKMYHDLGIRFYRTSYESFFSLSPDNYSISCRDPYSCTWIELHNVLSTYENISLFASIWSPPHYMKNPVFNTLESDYELKYLYFIKNITSLIKSQFNLTVERVSPINEPENVFALWEHTNMSPFQLCKMVQAFDDPLVSLCPENAYFWMSELYENYTDSSTGLNCSSACEIYATHAYALNIDYFDPNHLLAYYDLGEYNRSIPGPAKPIWMTEVSSTFDYAELNQMEEAIDLATNIINFLGTTCVQRYYFWYMYTLGPLGESLIWGNHNSTQLFLPKKYYVFRHFTKAAFGRPKLVSRCDSHLKETPFDGKRTNDNPGSSSGESGYYTRPSRHGHGNKTGISCMRFGEEKIILLNKYQDRHHSLRGFQCETPFCCTTSEFDWFCVIQQDKEVILPKGAVCSCGIRKQRGHLRVEFSYSSSTVTNEVNDSERPEVVMQPFRSFVTSLVYDFHYFLKQYYIKHLLAAS